MLHEQNVFKSSRRTHTHMRANLFRLCSVNATRQQCNNKCIRNHEISTAIFDKLFYARYSFYKLRSHDAVNGRRLFFPLFVTIKRPTQAKTDEIIPTETQSRTQMTCEHSAGNHGSRSYGWKYVSCVQHRYHKSVLFLEKVWKICAKFATMASLW